MVMNKFSAVQTEPVKAEVRCARVGVAGVITLSRSQSLNALTHGMCLEIEAALDAWAENVDVRLVIIDAEGEKAFCAGGDIVQLYENGRSGNLVYGRTFWRDEYRLNHKLATYGKPIVSFMQGIVMGGGVGLGCHVSHRIAGLGLKLAMPECGIGLIPDVGCSRLLRRAPRGIGKFVGTTGYRMGTDDALSSGFVDHVVPEEDWPVLKEVLIAEGDPSIISTYHREVEVGLLRSNAQEISSCFGQGTIQDALYLMEYAGAWSTSARNTIETGSPISILCTEHLLDELPDEPSVAEALRLEYRFTYRASVDGDFVEGVRAKLIDRDNDPKWKYSGLAEVPQEIVTAMLAPLGDDELLLNEDEK